MNLMISGKNGGSILPKIRIKEEEEDELWSAIYYLQWPFFHPTLYPLANAFDSPSGSYL